MSFRWNRVDNELSKQTKGRLEVGCNYHGTGQTNFLSFEVIYLGSSCVNQPWVSTCKPKGMGKTYGVGNEVYRFSFAKQFKTGFSSFVEQFKADFV